MTAGLFIGGQAFAQADPSLDAVYQAARSGHVEEAQRMMSQVLRDHPRSAKAHFVEAELLQRQGKIALAKQQLVEAEQIAPDLSFAAPDSVRHLRLALTASNDGRLGSKADTARTGFLRNPVATEAAPREGMSILSSVLIAIGAGAIAAWFLMRLWRSGAAAGGMRRAEPGVNPAIGVPIGVTGTSVAGVLNTGGAYPPAAPGSAFGSAFGGMSGGVPGSTPGSVPGNTFGNTVGGRLAGGLASGLAAGAGIAVAESISRRFEAGSQTGPGQWANPLAGTRQASGAIPSTLDGTVPHTSSGFGDEAERLARRDGATDPNADLGGKDFGIDDPGSANSGGWDDGGSSLDSSDGGVNDGASDDWNQ